MQQQTGLVTEIVSAEVVFEKQPFDRPLMLSTGAIEQITEAIAVVRVRVDGKEAEGRGSIYLSDLWAWPDPALDHATRDAAMRAYCNSLAENLAEICGHSGHPLSLGLRLHDVVIEDEQPLDGHTLPPALARAVCSSPFDAAIHDATGIALGVSAFDWYTQTQPIAEADKYFGGEGETCNAIAKLVSSQPATHSPCWWIVGKADDLENDLLPKVQEQGLFAFKLKIMGKDAAEDAARTAQIAQAARNWGITNLRLSIDSNEGNPDSQSVLDYLDKLQALDAQAYDALEMIEQPTGRDIEANPNDWQAVAARKPVLVDEGLMTLESMLVAKDQHWSGFALKTCKGHSFALVAAAWAKTQSMTLSLQDLTNPGLSAIHSALFAARVPTINGVELNSPQFTPKANQAYLDRFPNLFQTAQGKIELPNPALPGLGSTQ